MVSIEKRQLLCMNADIDPAFLPVAYVSQFPAHVVADPEDLPGMFHIDLSRIGQGQRISLPVKEPDAQVLLHLGNDILLISRELGIMGPKRRKQVLLLECVLRIRLKCPLS